MKQDVMEEAGLGPILGDRGDVVVDKPQDLYQQVADAVATRVASGDYLAWFASSAKKNKNAVRVEQSAATKEGDAEKLLTMVREGTINRKLVKSHVMTFVYGKTAFGRWLTLKDYMTDHMESNTPEPIWPNVPTSVVSYLQEIIAGAIKERVPAAVEAMQWLADVGAILADAGLPVTWATPINCLITQDYRDIRTRQVDIHARYGITMSAITKLTLANEPRPDDPRNKRKQSTALAPNFIHSLDASALAETVRLSKGRGITSFAMIHDSYATTAAETDVLREALWAGFTNIYTRRDPLRELRDLVVSAVGDEVPTAPELRGLTFTTAPYIFTKPANAPQSCYNRPQKAQ